MNDKSSYTKAEAKIHILYLVDHVPGVTYSMLRDSCMQSLYVDFFDFSDAYEELISGNLMDKVLTEDSVEVLKITDGGKAVLSDLVASINDKLLAVLDTIAADLARTRKENDKVSCRKMLTGEGYEVILKINDDKITSEIKVKCASEEEADRLMRNWKSASGSLFDYLSGGAG